MLKKIGLLITIAGFGFSTIAQNIEGVNARLDGMGGSGVTDDIGWTVGYPRSICAYPDQIQGSAIIRNILGKGKTFGRIIIIKSIGDHFFLGLTANNNKVLKSGFYYDAARFLNAEVDLEIGNINENFQTVPHLNVCYEPNDNFSFGIGGFYEGTSFKKSLTDTLNFKDSVNEKSIYHAGGIIDAKITAGPLTIVPSFKVGIPRINGIEENTNPVNINKSEWASESGLFLNAGTMFWADIQKTFSIFGVWYTDEGYQFSKGDSLGYEYNTRIVDWFIGVQPSFSDNLFFAPEYDGGVEIANKTASDANIAGSSSLCNDTTWVYWYHDFRLGIEKRLPGIWIFDALIPRGGLSYKIGKEIITIENSVNKDVYYEREVKTTKTNQDELAPTAEGLKVTAGIGVQKGRFTLDVSANLLVWDEGNGFISGPAASMATLTFDIGRKKGRGDSYVEPEPESKPTEEQESVPIEESNPEEGIKF